MSTISRREFLVRSSLAAGAVAAAPHLFAADAAPAAPPKLKSGADIVTVGRTKIKSSVLGLGTGMTGGGHSSNHLRMGQVEFTKLVRHALDQGVRYIDTADMYGTHIFIREALKKVDRDNLFIQTKTLAKNPEVLKADIERFRQELGMSKLDSLLLHCMTAKSWPVDMRPVIDALIEAREKKLVRAVGISCHGWDPLAAAAELDWLDVELVRINPFGAAMDAAPEKVEPVLKKMHDKGRGIVGMKICGGGEKTGAEDRQKSLKYVLGLGTVDCFAVGCETTKQVDEILAQIEIALKA